MECLLPYILKYGDCTSYNGQIRENVGLYIEVSDYS